MPSARDAGASAAAAPTLPAPEPDAQPSDGPLGLQGLIAKLRDAAPDLSQDGAILLVCQMSHERGGVPSAEDAIAWVGHFKRLQPMAWPAAVAGDALRFAKLLDFARYPKAVEAQRLRELMSHVHAVLPS